MNFIDFETKIRRLNDSKGWKCFDLSDPSSITPQELYTRTMLIASEVSEAGEEIRKAISPEKGTFSLDMVVNGKYRLELADIFIRLIDLSTCLGIDLAQAVEDKLDINAGRPYRHNRLF